MKKFALAMAITLLMTGAAAAQQAPTPAPEAVAPAQVTPASVPVNPAPPQEGAIAREISSIKNTIDEKVTEFSRDTTPENREIIATGLGATVGLVASSFVMGEVISPILWYMTTGIGLPGHVAHVLTSLVTLVGVAGGTYAGGVYGRNLVNPQ